MYLQQGDIQLVSNHFVLHARTEFDDHTPEEIADADPGNGLLPPLGRNNTVVYISLLYGLMQDSVAFR